MSVEHSTTNYSESALQSGLLDAIPGTAFLVEAKTRKIVASNKNALSAGATPGTFCYAAWALRDEPCPGCRAPQAWGEDPIGSQRVVEARSHRWNTGWAPVSDNLYLHFFTTQDETPVTDRQEQPADRNSAIDLSVDESYRTLFNTMTQGVVYVDRRGHLIDANPAAEKILGMNADEVRKRSTASPQWEAVHEDGSPFPEETHPVMVALATGKIVSDTVMGVHNPVTRNRVWISITAIPLFRPDEAEPYQVYALFNDVTEQKEAEKNYRTLFREIFDGFALHEIIYNGTGEPVDYRFLAVNPSFERMTRLKSEDMIGRTVLEVMPDIEQHWIQTYGNVALTGIPVVFENYAGALGKYFKVTAFRPDPGRFACIFVDITDRKRAEEAFIQEYHKSRDILTSIPSGLFIYKYVHPDRLLLEYANPEAEKLTGISSGKWIGSEFIEIWPEGNSPGLFERLMEVVRTGENTEFEEVSYRSDRVDRAFRIRGFAIPGNRVGIAFENLTRIKTAEEALSRSEEALRALIEGLPDIIMQFDREGRQLFVSENVNEIVELTAGKMIGKTLRELGFPGESCTMWEAAIAGVVEKGLPHESEFSFDGKKGHTTFNWRLIPEFDRGGSVRSVLSICRDITHHRLVEGRFRKFFSQIAELAYMVDLDGNIIDINDAALSRLGYSREDLVGKSLEMIYAPECRTRVVDLFAQWRKTGNIKNEEMVIISRTGEQRNVLLNASAIRDEKGAIVHSVSLQTDITELKLYQEEVQRSQKLDSLGVLAGGIAHDFNNLLGGLFGYIDLGNDIADDPRVKQYLSKALNTIERARGLTQQLLTFAKGGGPVKKVDHLFPFVEETARFALSGSRVSCICSIEEGLKPCLFDRNQIGQAIDNITINALQAMPGGGTLTITAGTVSDAGHPSAVLDRGEYIHIAIADTGIGIPAEYLSRIFDPFYTTKPKGHGLGLATCYSIVSKHGGTIEVESVPGKGTTFHLYFPVSYEGTAELPASEHVMHTGAGTVLVMDDEEVMRDTIGDMLTSMGYTPVIFVNGAEVLDYFRKHFSPGEERPAAMIFDLTIPGGKGGKETIEEVRLIAADLPVFVASGYADDPVMADPQKYGFSGSIEKPFRKSELEKLLKKYFDGR